MIKKIQFVTFVLLMLSTVVHAGIIWNSESDFIAQGETKCYPYGLYNPGSLDITMALYVSGDIAKIADQSKSDIKLIVANTTNDKAVFQSLCFTAPNGIYKEQCILPGIGCKQECGTDTIGYLGKVSAIRETVSQSDSNRGSAVTLSESAPMELIVRCEPHSRDLKSLYLLGIVIVVIIIVFSYVGIKKSKNGKFGKK